MNPFETQVRSRVEGYDNEKVIDVLLNDFPSELQARLEEEVAEMDAQTASDYLIAKLIQRKKTLVEWGEKSIPPDIEVSHDCPLAVLQSLEQNTAENASHLVLGAGMNGKIYQSIRQQNACYKVLFLERSKELQTSIVREAVMQHEVEETMATAEGGANVPHVLCFVDHEQVGAIMMEKITGESILNILSKEGCELPDGFDVHSFFERLEQSVRVMNEHGYFHRDLTNNAGNVMVDAEGAPWIIDFGSTIKAFSTEPQGESYSYQITPNGSRILANDISGVRQLKNRVLQYMRTGNKEKKT